MVVLTKNNVAMIKLKTEAFTNIANDYLTKLVLKHNFRMLKTKEVIKIFVNQKNLEEKLQAFASEFVLGTKPNLCEIRIILEDDATYVRGLLSKIASELTLHQVNIHDIIVGVPEILIYVEEKDLVTAQKCMMELRKGV
jgi:RNA-binding protein YhbY